MRLAVLCLDAFDFDCLLQDDLADLAPNLAKLVQDSDLLRFAQTRPLDGAVLWHHAFCSARSWQHGFYTEQQAEAPKIEPVWQRVAAAGYPIATINFPAVSTGEKGTHLPKGFAHKDGAPQVAQELLHRIKDSAIQLPASLQKLLLPKSLKKSSQASELERRLSSLLQNLALSQSALEEISQNMTDGLSICRVEFLLPLLAIWKEAKPKEKKDFPKVVLRVLDQIVASHLESLGPNGCLLLASNFGFKPSGETVDGGILFLGKEQNLLTSTEAILEDIGPTIADFFGLPSGDKDQGSSLLGKELLRQKKARSEILAQEDLADLSSQALWNLAQDCISQNDWTRALRPLHRFTRLNEKNLDAQLLLATSLSEMGFEDECERLLDDLARVTGDQPRLRIASANCSLRKGDPTRALMHTERAAGRLPRPTHTESAQLADLFVRCGETNTAISYAEKSLTSPATAAQGHLALAAIAWKKEQFEKAAEEALNAQQLNPAFTDCYVMLAKSCAKLGLQDAALHTAHEGLRAAPTHRELLELQAELSGKPFHSTPSNAGDEVISEQEIRSILQEEITKNTSEEADDPFAID